MKPKRMNAFIGKAYMFLKQRGGRFVSPNKIESK